MDKKSYLHRQRADEPQVRATFRDHRDEGRPSSRGDLQSPDALHSTSPSSSLQQTPKRVAARAAMIGQSLGGSSHASRSASLSPSTSLERTMAAAPDRMIQQTGRSSRSGSIGAGAISRADSHGLQTSRMSPGESDRDALEVRNVSMPDGQSASLVLEDGKLQRIVSSSGNVVEVLWRGREGAGQDRRGRDRAGPDRQLAIKLRTPASPTIPEESPAKQQGGFRQLANTLQSQRLAQTPRPKPKNSLLSVPVSGARTTSMRDMRGLHSLDISKASQAGATQSHRPSMQLPTKPTHKAPARTSSHNDLSTIANGPSKQTPENWNPMGSSWLPPSMLAQKDSGAAAPKATTVHATPPRPQPQRQSPRDPLTSSKAATPTPTKSTTPTKSSDSKGKQGLPSEKNKIWKTIKAFLHIPSTKKKKKEKGEDQKQGKGSKAARALSFSASGTGKEATMTSVKEDEDRRMRASSPAVPSSVRPGSGAGLPAGNEGMTVPSSTAVAPQRMPKVEEPVEYEDMSTPEEKLAAYSAPKAQALAVPAAPQRQFQFGPNDPSKPPFQSGSTQQPATQSLQSQQHAMPRVFPDRGAALRPSEQQALQSEVAMQPMNAPKKRALLAGHWQKNFAEGVSGSKVDDLLNVSSLQRLAREKTMEMQIIETEEAFEIRWHIPLNGSSSKISKVDRYPKNGEVVEGVRRDGRSGVLRSQLTFTPEGHVHIRALQGAPYSSVFHDRLKLSSGGRRIKLEQKFQLLEPGVPPVKHFSIWQRVE